MTKIWMAVVASRIISWAEMSINDMGQLLGWRMFAITGQFIVLTVCISMGQLFLKAGVFANHIMCVCNLQTNNRGTIVKCGPFDGYATSRATIKNYKGCTAPLLQILKMMYLLMSDFSLEQQGLCCLVQEDDSQTGFIIWLVQSLQLQTTILHIVGRVGLMFVCWPWKKLQRNLILSLLKSQLVSLTVKE